MDLRKDPDEVIMYKMDTSNLVQVKTAMKQSLDLFYSSSTLVLDDSPLKAFGSYKTEESFFEFKSTQAN